MPRRKTRPRIGKTGCLFWIVILLVIIVIIVYRGKGSLRQTFSTLKNSISGKEVTEEVKKEKTEAPEETAGNAENQKASETGEGTQVATEEAEPSSPASEKEKKPAVKIKEEPTLTKEKQKKVGNKAVTEKTLAADLFFVRFNQNDGSIRLVPVARKLEYKDSPITKTINALLNGPTQSEQKNGIISLIPEGTSLISARIENSLLTLNFSSQFEANYSGREAILLQLSQVLFTSFGFSQVSGVSILIEGKKKQYITGEGIPLKEMYTKQDLAQLKM